MKLNLKKDLVIFDIESTGLSTSTDRIVQLAIVKIFADGRETLEKCRLINPEIPISEEAMEVHKITNEMVKDQPTFGKIAKALLDLIGDADLCGFNSNRFDVPMLIEEFYRAGLEIDMSNRKTIDVWRIFQKMEPRDLTTAYSFYCGKKLEGAHDALNDVRATIEVLESQLDKYENVTYEDKEEGEIVPVVNDMDKLNDFTNFKGRLDFSNRFVEDENGIPIFNFGKHQGKPVGEIVSKDESYYNWFMKSDFTSETKSVLSKIMEEYKNSQKK